MLPRFVQQLVGCWLGSMGPSEGLADLPNGFDLGEGLESFHAYMMGKTSTRACEP